MASVFTETGTERYVCRCLRVTESDVRDAVSAGVVRDLQDLMEHTGAGTGCMACRFNLARLMHDGNSGQGSPPVQSSGCSPTCVVR